MRLKTTFENRKWMKEEMKNKTDKYEAEGDEYHGGGSKT
jgi:hypothetical protein